jgi:hypothetical protein
MENQKQGPHGIKDPILGRNQGNNEEIIDNKRARYGEDPAFKMDQGERIDTDFNVNQVATPNNPTKQERINPGTKYSGDGFFNHFMSG